MNLVQLGEIAKIDRNIIPPESIREGTSYVGLEHIDGDGHFVSIPKVQAGELASSKFAFNETHILYGKLRPYLKKIARPSFCGICSTDLLPIKPSNKVDRNFLFYFLRQPKMIELATAKCSGANLPRLSPKQLSEFKIPVPPLPTQRKIAAILEKTESALEKRREANRLTDEFLKSAFLDMFGDPVRNPKGWETIPIGNMVVSIKNENPPSYPEKTYDYIDISSVNNISKEIEDIKKTTGNTAPSRARQLVEHGDVLVSTVRPNLNAVAIVPDKFNNPIASTGFCILRPNKKIIFSEYLFEICKLPSFVAHLTKIAKGASYPAVTDIDVMKIYISVPPLPLQQRFSALVEKVEALKQKHRASETELQNLFNSLMQRAFRAESMS